MPRPDWDRAQDAMWTRAAVLDPAGDPAIAALREEAGEFLPLVGALRRLLVVARTRASGLGG